MFHNIAFIGGIHGVGKSILCKHICGELKLKYLSASYLLKWKELNSELHDKRVKSISETQDRLLISLKNTVQENNSYLLDGHYCLLNDKNAIINIPIGTFKQINPISFNIILGDISEIKSSLEKRDNISYDYKLLEMMQDSELQYAKHLAKTFKVILNIGTRYDFSEMRRSLHKIFQV